MSEKPPFPIFIDEFGFTKEEILTYHRLHRLTRFYRGWMMGEQFDDRYDTEVGGVQQMIVQTLDHSEGVHCNDVDSLIPNPEVVFRERPPMIHDCRTGDLYHLEEAEKRPELKLVVDRLKERMVEYQAFINRNALPSP